MADKQGVRASDFNRFLKAKAPEKPCPECGVNHWALSKASDDESSDPLVQAGIVMGANTNRFMPVHTLFCTNCGFMKFFAAAIVEDWIEKNG
ncbi:hypothetical protein [Sinorhizobium medicae]|uniref:Uncharacterized protein n=1 Tax=Sinorhizobium medicae TaxID=110321 RepID=A0A6G1WR12_9HYPH|nr:hypothetical protein [Sinorhizobium medicae]MDX0517166.1 hypothetical protein [Sinorhizobium medicae]MDX0603790.1 hypothetical protein [Sinorhizobium medicae]MDX0617336.1 hypothetical protein [Sinorhizobium medicae]MDX0623036.1 hypothetical protein [Sinorhizobium medicae]MDX0665927.1 hypothetical protein [Sinorhizobium medicae]